MKLAKLVRIIAFTYMAGLVALIILALRQPEVSPSQIFGLAALTFIGLIITSINRFLEQRYRTPKKSTTDKENKL